MAALNGFLVLLTYFFTVVLGVLMLKYWHGIDLVGLLLDLWPRNIPFGSEFLSFLKTLVEHFLIAVFVFGLFHAAVISNNELRILEDSLQYTKGLLMVETGEVDWSDVRQVYTEDYPFFWNTKKLVVKSLSAETLEFPYVRSAEEVKSEILNRVKERSEEDEVESMLQRPITAPS